MTAHVLQLETDHNAAVALRAVSVDCSLVGLFMHTGMAQRFVNTADRSIEVVYTFPTPMHAVFLGLQVTIGDKVLEGVVLPDDKADRGYEEAIQDGDAAILVRRVEPGLYSVSVGNMLPGEAITLRYTYAEQLRWQGNAMRITLPTTIAPLYGDGSAIALEPQETIEHGLDSDYALALQIHVTGELAQCAVASPSHAIRCRARGRASGGGFEKPSAIRSRACSRPADLISGFDDDGFILDSLHPISIALATRTVSSNRAACCRVAIGLSLLK